MIIKKAKNVKNTDEIISCIQIEVDGQILYAPLDPDNRHYAEILKQVSEGTLTIEEAD